MTVLPAQYLSLFWELAQDEYGGVSGSVIWGWDLQAWGIRMYWLQVQNLHFNKILDEFPNHLDDWDSRPPCYDPCKLLQFPCHVPPHSPAKLHFSLFPHHATSPTIPTFVLAVPSAQSSPFILLLPGENSYSSLEDQLTCHLLLEAFPSSFFAGPNPHVIPPAA